MDGLGAGEFVRFLPALFDHDGAVEGGAGRNGLAHLLVLLGVALDQGRAFAGLRPRIGGALGIEAILQRGDQPIGGLEVCPLAQRANYDAPASRT